MSETFNFVDAPPIQGAHFMFYGQAYFVEAVEPYTRRDGTLSAIVHWTTACASCSTVVRFTTGLRDRIDCRRCPACIKKRRARAYGNRRFQPHGWKGSRK